VAFKAPPHCPRLQGLLASRVKNNVGLGFSSVKKDLAHFDLQFFELLCTGFFQEHRLLSDLGSALDGRRNVG